MAISGSWTETYGKTATYDAITMKNDDLNTINTSSLEVAPMTSSSIIINNEGVTIDLGGRRNGKEIMTPDVIQTIGRKIRSYRNRYKTIEKVIFNDPAVIIIFKDGSKTVAKCSENDEWDPEKGFVIALLKYYLGKSDLGWLIRKYVEPQMEKEQEYSLMHLPQTLAEIGERLRQWADGYNVGEYDDRTWDEAAETKEE